MNELQEELDAINFADADELSLVVGVGWRMFRDDGALSPAPLACAERGLLLRRGGI